MKFKVYCSVCKCSQLGLTSDLHNYIFKCCYCGNKKKIYNKRNGTYQLKFYKIEDR
jgi:hypothetical protein